MIRNVRAGRLRKQIALWLSLGPKIAWSVWVVIWSLLFGPSFFLGFFGVVAWLAVPIIVASYVASMRFGMRDAELAIDNDAIRIGDRIIPRAEVASVDWIASRVEIRLRNGDAVRIETDSASAIAKELGFGTGRATHWDLEHRARRILHPFLAGASIVFSFILVVTVKNYFELWDRAWSSSTMLTLCVTWIVYGVAKRGVSGPDLELGSDGIRVLRRGVLLDGYLSGPSFIPLDAIARVGQFEPGAPIRLDLVTGKHVMIGGMFVDSGRRDGLAREIESLVATRSRARVVELERGGQSVSVWRKRVEDVARGGYRVAGVDRALVEQILEAPGSTTEERIAAGMALRVSDADGKARIRVAADRCVDRRTRAALEALAEDEIDERVLEKALPRKV